MRIAIVNQFVPPEPPPTARLAGELGEYLRLDGHEVIYIHDDQGYQKKHRRRTLGELLAHWRILRSGVFRSRVDLVLCFSSPPCLPVTAFAIARWHRARFVHWAMDIYPEIAVALGEITPGLIAKTTGALMTFAYRQADLVVALDDDMAEVLKKRGVQAEVLPPWISTAIPPGQIEDARTVSSPPDNGFTWLYSGNLGRAHEWKSLLDAQALVEKEDPSITLLFQGRGPSRKEAQSYAEALGLERCLWKDYTPEAELVSSLAQANVLVATQKPEAKGLLWPSKLALMMRLRRPILWIGPRDTAIFHDLSIYPENAVFEAGEASATAAWLLRLKSTGIAPLTNNATLSPKHLFDPEAGGQKWRDWIGSLKKG